MASGKLFLGRKRELEAETRGARSGRPDAFNPQRICFGEVSLALKKSDKLGAVTTWNEQKWAGIAPKEATEPLLPLRKHAAGTLELVAPSP